MSTPQCFLRPLRTTTSSLKPVPDTRWLCPSCKRRLQQVPSLAIGRRPFSTAKRADRTETSASALQDIETNGQVIGKKTETSVNDVYEPAATWAGLERVGGKEWRRKRQVAKPFEGFFSNSEESNDRDPSVAVCRAVVETLAMRASGGQDLGEFHELGEASEKATITVAPDARSVAFDMDQQDGTKLSYTAIPLSSSDFPDTDEPFGASKKKTTAEKTMQEDSKRMQSWADVPLRDPSFKFTVVKRVMQLIGKPISDPIIQRSKTAGELSSNLLIKPKPKKLYKALQDNDSLSNLTNVKVHDRRVTPIDKETGVGRWKVIEQELLYRDLPVTGHGPR
ncbi:hypothetical protein EV356DRAFT_501908 [Viridothelium virens]|uniref:Large ribosomal subunit protein mL50 n=1 Tax=Viridothelium virens TaxID=1048519 RepID=A0A6A6H953_VIRVR|nr:hypothetical protein EV356DRAFT_501908 [Viridothelium virens]